MREAVPPGPESGEGRVAQVWSDPTGLQHERCAPFPPRSSVAPHFRRSKSSATFIAHRSRRELRLRHHPQQLLAAFGRTRLSGEPITSPLVSPRLEDGMPKSGGRASLQPLNPSGKRGNPQILEATETRSKDTRTLREPSSILSPLASLMLRGGARPSGQQVNARPLAQHRKPRAHLHLMGGARTSG